MSVQSIAVAMLATKIAICLIGDKNGDGDRQDPDKAIDLMAIWLTFLGIYQPT